MIRSRTFLAVELKSTCICQVKMNHWCCATSSRIVYHYVLPNNKHDFHPFWNERGDKKGITGGTGGGTGIGEGKLETQGTKQMIVLDINRSPRPGRKAGTPGERKVGACCGKDVMSSDAMLSKYKALNQEATKVNVLIVRVVVAW